MSEDRLELRAKPRSVRRFNRKALIGIASLASVMVLFAATFALQSPDRAGNQAPTELYKTTTLTMPDGLNDLPATYEEVQPTLGPPLPGDLGKAFVGTPSVEIPRNNPFRYQPDRVPTGGNRRSASPSPAAQLAASARTSSLFFISKQNGNGQPSIAGGQNLPFSLPAGVQGQGNLQDTASLLSPNLPNTPIGDDQNRQQRKEAFLGAEIDEAIYNPHRLQAPVSPYQVMAGTIISASLVTGINSDLPGQIIAQVTENVYDTPSGDYLLIPQGSRLIGRYDSVIAFGQSRALVAWTRLIMPDGTSISMDNLPGVDLSGYAGLEDKVDFHTLGLFKAAILSSVLSIGSEIGRDSNDSDILEALRDGGQRTFNQAGQEVVTRQLNVQPTIKVRPGWRLRVIVNKDMILQPYGG